MGVILAVVQCEHLRWIGRLLTVASDPSDVGKGEVFERPAWNVFLVVLTLVFCAGVILMGYEVGWGFRMGGVGRRIRRERLRNVDEEDEKGDLMPGEKVQWLIEGLLRREEGTEEEKERLEARITCIVAKIRC